MNPLKKLIKNLLSPFWRAYSNRIRRIFNECLCDVIHNYETLDRKSDELNQKIESMKNELLVKIDCLNSKYAELEQKLQEQNYKLDELYDSENRNKDEIFTYADVKRDEILIHIDQRKNEICNFFDSKVGELNNKADEINYNSNVSRNLMIPEFYPEVMRDFCSLRKIKDNVYFEENVIWEQLQQFKNNFNVDYDWLKKLLWQKFRFNHQMYINNNYFEKKKRLFVTTGTLSLLNALCYIKQTGNEELYDDTLIVIMGSNTHRFTEAQIVVAETHKFEKIFLRNRGDDLATFVAANDMYNFDECIIVHHVYTLALIKDLFVSAKVTYIFETPTLVSANETFGNISQSLYIKNYSGKFDYAYPETKRPVQYADNKIFSELLSSTRKKINLKIELPTDEKWVLFLGPDKATVDLTEEKDAYVLKYIRKIQEIGYKVLYKNHPRVDDKFYEEHGLDLLKVSYPIELYDLSNFVAVVGFRTTALLTLPEWEIPTLCIITNEICNYHNIMKEFLTNFKRITFVVKEYVMPYEVLLEADKSKTATELRNDLLLKQKDFLSTKPVLSKNTEYKRLFPLEEDELYML